MFHVATRSRTERQSNGHNYLRQLHYRLALPGTAITATAPLPQAVGASGAIFGIVGAFAAFCLMNRSVLGKENSRRALTGVGQTLAMNLALGLSSTHIDNMGHVGVS